MHRILGVFAVVVFLLFISSPVRGDELDNITKQLADLKSSLSSSQQATATNETNLQHLLDQLNAIKVKITGVEQDIAQKEVDIQKGEQALAFQKKVLEQRTVSYYKNAQSSSLSLTDYIISTNLSNSLRNFFYQKTLVDDDKKAIIEIVLYVKSIEERKQALQEEKDKLAVLKDDVDKQSTFLAGEVAKSKQYEAQLSQQIAVLSARQQQLLAQKLAGLNIPLFAYNTQGGCSSDLNPSYKDPGFGGTKFGFFTFGVPNRVGLNQYGALGRAQDGESYDQILHAYYNFDGYQDFSNITIKVNDSNGINSGNIIWSGSLDDYVKRIYEVPDSWPAAALDAQAIAARSYALAVTNNGSMSICANQNCQVFKSDPKGGNWDSAVNNTSNKAMMQGGQPVKAWFSSTHGGYIFSSGDIGWSQTPWTKRANDLRSSVNSFSDLQNNAYDKDSPWFYCDWGGRSEYNNTAWLKSDEVADIVNVLSLVKRDSSTAVHLVQTDKPNSQGSDTWDAGRVKDELRNRGGSPYNSIDSIDISWDKDIGKTNSITVHGDAGATTFDAGDFKNYFNLRAPANIQIVGPLFNVERR